MVGSVSAWDLNLLLALYRSLHSISSTLMKILRYQTSFCSTAHTDFQEKYGFNLC